MSKTKHATEKYVNDNIKETVPVIKSFDLVLEKDLVFRVGEGYPLEEEGLEFSKGDCYKVELYLNGEFVDSATEYLVSDGYMLYFGSMEESPLLGNVVMVCPNMGIEYIGDFQLDEAGENMLPVEGYSLKVYKKP